MLDVGSSASAENGEDDLAIFVDRLAAAGSDESTAAAKAQVRGAIVAGYSPPGLRRLAEALAASVSELPPAPRRPVEDAGSVVGAMRSNPLVVLEEFDVDAVAATVAALLADGRRVVLTAPAPAPLAAVRNALPVEAAELAVDAFPALPPAELRELRRLLATSTPARRERPAQQFPAPAALPPCADVEAWGARAAHSQQGGPAAGMIPALLAELDPMRRDAVTSVAQCVGRSLSAMQAGGDIPWAWMLLSDLIYGRHKPVFDRMLEDTAQAVAALERSRQAPVAEVTGPLPPGAVDILRRYRDFLDAGGRSRAYFRSPAQREVQPVLRLVRVNGRVPETEAQVRRMIEHLELGQRLGRIDGGCAEIGIAPPRDESELVTLADTLLKVAAAARSVGALRHDVLFIAPSSPLSVPDVETAEEVARAILDYAEHGSADEARTRLGQMADHLAAAVTGNAAVEHLDAVAALRAGDARGYAAAVDALESARGEAYEEHRKIELLRRLGEGSPRLAAALSVPGEVTVPGHACFVAMDALLTTLPPPDSADVVLVLGAADLGVERLLLTAVAPRMIAVVGPGDDQESSPSLLSVLQRASALVIRGRTAAAGGRVVRMEPRPTSVPAAGT
ncbi:hypothetical protein [Pseudonocardia sp. GCM10023141]|uniref:hypothetical protein n=1 Tax=Pseudonocardia sp. GCM10023141 TaxID=3252653 RepID=UPI00360E1706